MTFCINYKSWVLAWLFLSCATIFGQISEPAEPVIGLIKERFLTREDGATAIGIALTKGCRGEIYALFNAPLSIVVWESDEGSAQEFAGSFDMFTTPADLVNDGGMELLLVDPWHLEILRFSRRLQSLPSVTPDVSEGRFEPLSICRIRDGTMYIINRADNDVWRIDRDGKAMPLGWSPSRAGRITAPARIRYVPEIDKLLILDSDGLKLSPPHGTPGLAIKTKVGNPSGIGANDQEAWVAGEGLACISLTEKLETFYVPPDSLKSWGVFPAADVTPAGRHQLYILPRNGGRVLVMKILRGFSERP